MQPVPVCFLTGWTEFFGGTTVDLSKHNVTVGKNGRINADNVISTLLR